MKAQTCIRRSHSILASCSRASRSPLLRQQQRGQSTAAAVLAVEEEDHVDDDSFITRRPPHEHLPSPPPYLAKQSSRLNALHARLSLPSRFPKETLARCLISPSADPNPKFNNASMSVLGNAILSYYTCEAVMCRYPRLPTQILAAAMEAYHGPATLASLTQEWGVEPAAAPGGEVDSGLLQFRRVQAGNASVMGTGIQLKDIFGKRLPPSTPHLTTTPPRSKSSSRSKPPVEEETSPAEESREQPVSKEEHEINTSNTFHTRSKLALSPKGVTLQAASSVFVQALFGAYYLHTGLAPTKAFYDAHIMSRHLDFSSLFAFQQPTRDLSRLCARENFLPPVARILAETGRLSRHPVFVVGVFSGREKLGEGSGASLDEARIRASVNALKGWYLYSPLKLTLPSQAKEGAPFKPCMVDGGEVVV